MATGESYFTKIANEVLQEAEKLSISLEESLSALFSGGGGGDEQQQQQQQDEPKADVPPTDSEQEVWEEEFEEDADDFRSPLEDITEGVLGGIMSGQKQPEGLVEHFHAFRHAVTWSETFVLSLVAFQVFMFFVTIWVSRRKATLTARLSVMIFIAAVVRLAERLNSYGARHWTSFATQDYFDKRGIFVSIMLCAPLLIDCLIMLLCFLREASTLLVQVKSEKIRRERKKQKAADEKSGSGNRKKTSKTNPKKEQ